LTVNFEFIGEDVRESGEGESPNVFSGSEGDVSFLGQEIQVSHIRLFILRNNDVNHINDSDVILIHRFRVILEFKDLSIDFVDEKDWSDFFSHGLSEDGFGLDANSFNTVDDDEGTVGNSKCGGDFRGEIDVSWGVDEIDDVTLVFSGFKVSFVIE